MPYGVHLVQYPASYGGKVWSIYMGHIKNNQSSDSPRVASRGLEVQIWACTLKYHIWYLLMDLSSMSLSSPFLNLLNTVVGQQ